MTLDEIANRSRIGDEVIGEPVEQARDPRVAGPLGRVVEPSPDASVQLLVEAVPSENRRRQRGA